MAEYVISAYTGVYKRAVELYEEEKYNQAAQLFEEVVKNDPDNYEAAFYMGEICYYGHGHEVNVKLAFQNYMKAAINKINEACYMVGLCYLNGTGINQDSTQAVAWFTEAAKYAHAYSQYYLGLAYMNGDGVTKDIPRGCQWLVYAAKQGIVDAMKNAGICYEILGQMKGAATLYLNGAEAGDDYCQEHIADCYADGVGCTQCTELAVHYYELAANQGNVNAQVKMANRYAKGNGVPESIKKAIFWWNKAAEKDNPEAQYYLAGCYYEGNGVFKSYQSALAWWTRSANLGYVNAMKRLAEVSEDPGEVNVEPDLLLAKYWWEKSAEAGDTHAMFKLGEALEFGKGCTSNPEDAYKWYRLASTNGNTDAQEACKRFSKKLNGKIKLKK